MRDNPFAPFSHRTFRNFWVAMNISNIGSQVQAVTAAWVMTALTTSQEMVSLVQTATALPIMCGAVFAGVLADSFERRTILLLAQWFILVVSTVLTLTAFMGLLTPWLLISFTFLIGIGTALHQPSWQSSVGDWVPREDLPGAVSLNAMGMNITRAIGPAAGGFIVAFAGAAVAFTVNAISNLALLYGLVKWRPNRPEKRLPRESFGRALRTGLRFFAMSPRLQGPILRAAIFGFGAIPMQSLLPVVTRETLGGSAITYGVLLGCFGTGGVVAALYATRMRRFMRNETVARLGLLSFALALIVTALSPYLLVTAAMAFIAGFCWLSVLPLINVVTQMATPRWVVGRMLSLYLTGLFGGVALGGWVWGMVAEDFGLNYALYGAAVVLVLGAILGLFMPLSEISRENLEPLNTFVEPQLKLNILPSSGPIQIMIDYEIQDEDLPRFAELMQQRRIGLMREGARHWQLLRDLENPDIWIESFHFPTWLEYMRLHERRIQADGALVEELRKIHRGTGRPQVHRMIERETISPNDSHPSRRHVEPMNTV